MAVESYELRSQLTDPLNEVPDQLSLRSLPDVGRAQCLYAPTFGASARDQCAYARDLVKRMLWKVRA